MSIDTPKCVAVLTRCGPFSHRQAEALVPTLKPEEAQQLLALHAGLEQLEAPPDRKPGFAGQPGEIIPPSPEKRDALNKLATEIGERFRQLQDAIADRQAAEAEAAAAKPEAASPTSKPSRVSRDRPSPESPPASPAKP